MREKKSGIYRIRNLVNGKVYVGSTNNINKRWIEHKSFLKNNKHPNPHLQASWNKYGEENLIFEIIEEIENSIKELLCEREQYWNDFYDSSNREKGYNLRKIVESNLGVIFSEDHNKKISESHMGHKNHFFGKHHSPETKKKLSESKIGEKNPNYGKSPSEETRKKQSDIKKGKTLSDDHKKKLSESLTGLMIGENHPMYGKKGEEHPRYGKHHTPESKQKISENSMGKNSGEKSHSAKLTWKLVIEIREKWNSKNYKQKQLAKEYNVSIGTICLIVNNETWKEENNIEDKK